MKNNLDNSVPFDAKWWSTIPAIKETANFLCTKLSKCAEIKSFKMNRLKNHLKVILTNLHVAHSCKNKPYVAISMNKGSYKLCRRYPKLYLSYKYVLFLMKYLIDEGYIEFHKGVHFDGFKRTSRMKATQKLLRLFRKYNDANGITFRRNIPVVLRNEAGEDIDFNINDPGIKPLIVNVNRINKCLSAHSVCVNPPISEISEFNREYPDYLTRDKYTRVFNNSKFDEGGRFYRHWSAQIKSKYRKYITIDGQPTVELDYSCLHISMLYALEGNTPPHGDLYELVDIDNMFRPLIKKAFNIAINAKDEKARGYLINKYPITL